MNPGSLPLAHTDALPARARLEHPGPVLVAQAHPAGEQVAARGDDVGARSEQRDDVVDELVLGEAGPGLAPARGPGHVDAAVRLQLQDRVAVGRGQDAGRALAAELAGVDAVLGRVVHADADQVEATGGGSPRAAPADRCCRSPTGCTVPDGP